MVFGQQRHPIFFHLKNNGFFPISLNRLWKNRCRFFSIISWKTKMFSLLYTIQPDWIEMACKSNWPFANIFFLFCFVLFHLSFCHHEYFEFSMSNLRISTLFSSRQFHTLIETMSVVCCNFIFFVPWNGTMNDKRWFILEILEILHYYYIFRPVIQTMHSSRPF